MRRDADDPADRFFRAARWYLPPMAAEPEPDPTLACTYAMLAVYAKLDALIETMSADQDSGPSAAATLQAMARDLGWDAPSRATPPRGGMP